MPRDNQNPFDTAGRDVQRSAGVTHLSSVVKDIAETDLFRESKRDFFFRSLCNVPGEGKGRETDNRYPFHLRIINILLLAQTAGVCSACWRQLSVLPLLSLILQLSFRWSFIKSSANSFFVLTWLVLSTAGHSVFNWNRVRGDQTKTAPRWWFNIPQCLHQCNFAYCGCPFSHQHTLAQGHSFTARHDAMNHWNAAGRSVCVFTQSHLSIKHC